MSTRIEIKKSFENGHTMVEFREPTQVEDREYFRTFFHFEMTREEALKLANALENPKGFTSMDIADEMED